MTNEMNSMDIYEVLKHLPHRYPFLLIDRVLDFRKDEYLIALKNVTFNEPFFPGHFPHRPVMPGVMLIEGMAQTAGALCVHASKSARPKIVYFMTIDKSEFRKPVGPGDTVEYHMTKINQRRNMWWYRGEAKVRGQIVCEAEVSAMLVTE